MSIMTNLWITKYRPKTIDEIVLPEQTKQQIKQWINSGHIPNLLLIGNPGTGKTSLANVIKHSMNVEMLILNGSEERGIDVIRNKVQNFALAGSDKLKIIFFDEADGLTPEAQQSLRRIIEEYSDNTRFIFTANYDKFIQPLKDRFTIIYFDKLTKQDIKNIIIRILKNENIQYKDEDINKVIDILYPSLRSIIQTLQTNITEDNTGNKVLRLSNIVKSNDLELQQNIIEIFFKEDNIDKIRQLIADNNITDFFTLYRLFFDNVNEPIDKLIVAEFMYRDAIASDKEINFIGMLYALQIKALPFSLMDLKKFQKSNDVIKKSDNSIKQPETKIQSKHQTKQSEDLKQIEEITKTDNIILELDDLLE